MSQRGYKTKVIPTQLFDRILINVRLKVDKLTRDLFKQVKLYRSRCCRTGIQARETGARLKIFVIDDFSLASV